MMIGLVGVLQHAALVHAPKGAYSVLLVESLSEGPQHAPRHTEEPSRDWHRSTRRRMDLGRRTVSSGACARLIGR